MLPNNTSNRYKSWHKVHNLFIETSLAEIANTYSLWKSKFRYISYLCYETRWKHRNPYCRVVILFNLSETAFVLSHHNEKSPYQRFCPLKLCWAMCNWKYWTAFLNEEEHHFVHHLHKNNFSNKLLKLMFINVTSRIRFKLTRMDHCPKHLNVSNDDELSWLLQWVETTTFHHLSYYFIGNLKK